MTFWQRNQLRIAPFYFLAPGLILFLIYVIYPIIDSIWVSFHEWNGMPKQMVQLKIGNGLGLEIIFIYFKMKIFM